MLAIVLVILGVGMRFVPHAPNFTPVLAVALFSGLYLKRNHALLLPLFVLFLSDLVIGLHITMPFTYAGIVVCALIGIFVRRNKTLLNVFSAAIVCSLSFFLITNFGTWLCYYPLTTAGLAACFAAAVPFYRDLLLSSILYTLIFSAGYELLALRIRNTRFARLLLTA